MLYINNRFCVEADSNLLKDLAEENETRLEPRIMELLCLLLEKPGQVITRDQLVATIWKDYGGGDDGLTHAISTLRKVLHDHNKELIQTIPKKGYSFAGQVRHDLPTASRKVNKLLIAATILIIVAIPVALPAFRSSKNNSEQKLPFTEVAYPANNAEFDSSEENAQNTVVTVGPDHKKYKLVMIGDQPPRFYINDSLIPVHHWDPYMPLINKLKIQLKTPKK